METAGTTGRPLSECRTRVESLIPQITLQKRDLIHSLRGFALADEGFRTLTASGRH